MNSAAQFAATGNQPLCRQLEKDRALHHSSQLGDHGGAAPERADGAADQLLHNFRSGLDILDDPGTLAHQELHGCVLLHLLPCLLLLLHLPIDGDLALLGQLLDLLWLGLPPVDNVGAVRPQRPPRVDEGADSRVDRGLHYKRLVQLVGAGLLGSHKARANPHGVGAQAQGHGHAAAIKDATGRNNPDWLAGESGSLAPAEVDHPRDENGGGDITGVAATLATLCADDVHARIKALLHVLGMADHVHDRDAGRVQLVHGEARGCADCCHEERSLVLDDDVYELG
mmetsp:Transcript_35187/g.81681  ORF Transcript_35187/g.81681 Transcript_35187/m.81681 type:complete len:284 (-) Transcript_35187:354-1205(-)